MPKPIQITYTDDVVTVLLDDGRIFYGKEDRTKIAVYKWYEITGPWQEKDAVTRWIKSENDRFRRRYGPVDGKEADALISQGIMPELKPLDLAQMQEALPVCKACGHPDHVSGQCSGKGIFVGQRCQCIGW